jgi:hypothetical protein
MTPSDYAQRYSDNRKMREILKDIRECMLEEYTPEEWAKAIQKYKEVFEELVEGEPTPDAWRKRTLKEVDRFHKEAQLLQPHVVTLGMLWKERDLIDQTFDRYVCNLILSVRGLYHEDGERLPAASTIQRNTLAVIREIELNCDFGFELGRRLRRALKWRLKIASQLGFVRRMMRKNVHLTLVDIRKLIEEIKRRIGSDTKNVPKLYAGLLLTCLWTASGIRRSTTGFIGDEKRATRLEDVKITNLGGGRFSVRIVFENYKGREANGHSQPLQFETVKNVALLPFCTATAAITYLYIRGCFPKYKTLDELMTCKDAEIVIDVSKQEEYLIPVWDSAKQRFGDRPWSGHSQGDYVAFIALSIGLPLPGPKTMRDGVVTETVDTCDDPVLRGLLAHIDCRTTRDHYDNRVEQMDVMAVRVAFLEKLTEEEFQRYIRQSYSVQNRCDRESMQMDTEIEEPDETLSMMWREVRDMISMDSYVHTAQATFSVSDLGWFKSMTRRLKEPSKDGWGASVRGGVSLEDVIKKCTALLVRGDKLQKEAAQNRSRKRGAWIRDIKAGRLRRLTTYEEREKTVKDIEKWFQEMPVPTGVREHDDDDTEHAEDVEEEPSDMQAELDVLETSRDDPRIWLERRVTVKTDSFSKFMDKQSVRAEAIRAYVHSLVYPFFRSVRFRKQKCDNNVSDSKSLWECCICSQKYGYNYFQHHLNQHNSCEVQTRLSEQEDGSWLCEGCPTRCGSREMLVKHWECPCPSSKTFLNSKSSERLMSLHCREIANLQAALQQVGFSFSSESLSLLSLSGQESGTRKIPGYHIASSYRHWVRDQDIS